MFKRLSLVDSGAYGSIYLCKYKKMLKIVKSVEVDTNDCIALKSAIRETFILKNVKNSFVMNTNIIFLENTKEPTVKIVNYIMDIYSHNLNTQM